VRTRVLLAVAATTLAALTLAGCNGAASGGSGGTIKIGYPSEAASYTDLYVCEDQGIFEKHGLDVQLTLLKTSSQLLAAVSSGSVQIAGGDGAAVAAGAAKGADLKAVELKLPKYFVEVWGPKQYTGLDSLKGKTVGVTAPGSVTDRSFRALLKANGMTGQVDIKNLADVPSLLAAGQKGAIDALVTAPPAGVTTEKFGWHKVTDTTSIKSAASVYTVSGSYAKKNGATLQKFVDADVECLRYLKSHRKEAIASIAKHTQASTGQSTYAYDFFSKIFLTDPTVTPSLVQAALDEAGQSGTKADTVIDNSFVKKTMAGSAG
jgi:NitT/TauT family transport system substrate-binding protein